MRLIGGDPQGFKSWQIVSSIGCTWNKSKQLEAGEDGDWLQVWTTVHATSSRIKSEANQDWTGSAPNRGGEDWRPILRQHELRYRGKSKGRKGYDLGVFGTVPSEGVHGRIRWHLSSLECWSYVSDNRNPCTSHILCAINQVSMNVRIQRNEKGVSSLGQQLARPYHPQLLRLSLLK